MNRVLYSIRRLACAALVLGASTGPAAGHDFWIQPSRWDPQLEQVTSLYLLVGDGFLGEPVARDENFIEDFFVQSNGKRQLVVGMAGRSPAGLLRPTESGLLAIGYQSKPRTLTLEPQEFLAYLQEEGLDAVVEDRRAQGESEQPARERYVRCAKTLLRVEPASASGFDVALGLHLEIVPVDNPFTSSRTQFLVLTNGQPQPGVLVSALLQEKTEGAPKPVHLRTNAQGQVTFEVGHAGTWLITGTHMKRIPQSTLGRDDPTEEEGVDWESHWASLTFQRTREEAKAPAHRK